MPRRLVAVDLAGERVRLRAHRIADAAAAYALLANTDAILRWLVWEGPTAPEELAEHYARWCVESDGGPDLRLALEERASGALAGSIALRFGGHPGQGDLGYWVGLPFQRRGLGREALALAARLAFVHLGAHALHAWVFVGNVASRGLLESSGFTLTRTIPSRILKRGQRIDEWHFVQLVSEWRARGGDFRPSEERVVWSDAPAADPLDAPSRPFPRE